MTEKKVIKLNLGSGNFKLDDYINIDIRPETNPDIVCDALTRLPYISYSVTEIRCAEFLEHFTHKELIIILKEIYRVLKTGGLFRFGLPDGKYCSMLLADSIRNGQTEGKDIDYLVQNILGEPVNEEMNQKTITAKSHSNLLTQDYLELSLKNAGFKDIKFNQHMEEYDSWKEVYKIIGQATK